MIAWEPGWSDADSRRSDHSPLNLPTPRGESKDGITKWTKKLHDMKERVSLFSTCALSSRHSKFSAKYVVQKRGRGMGIEVPHNNNLGYLKLRNLWYPKFTLISACKVLWFMRHLPDIEYSHDIWLMHIWSRGTFPAAGDVRKQRWKNLNTVNNAPFVERIDSDCLCDATPNLKVSTTPSPSMPVLLHVLLLNPAPMTHHADLRS